jgi:putative endonuclease
VKRRWFVYILECADGSLYTGATTDLKRRMAEHRAGTAAYTRSHRPRRVVHSEKHAGRSSALKREAEIKRWPRRRKLKLISGAV